MPDVASSVLDHAEAMSEHILPQWGYGWGPGGGGPWWAFNPWWGIGALVVVAIAAAGLIVYLTRRPRLSQTGWRGAPADLSAAEDVLARRFAAGEISEQEYLSRLAVLRRPDR